MYGVPELGAAAGPGADATAGGAVVAWRSKPSSSAWRGCVYQAVAERRACARRT